MLTRSRQTQGGGSRPPALGNVAKPSRTIGQRKRKGQKCDRENIPVNKDHVSRDPKGTPRASPTEDASPVLLRRCWGKSRLAQNNSQLAVMDSAQPSPVLAQRCPHTTLLHCVTSRQNPAGQLQSTTTPLKCKRQSPGKIDQIIPEKSKKNIVLPLQERRNIAKKPVNPTIINKNMRNYSEFSSDLNKENFVSQSEKGIRKSKRNTCKTVSAQSTANTVNDDDVSKKPTGCTRKLVQELMSDSGAENCTPESSFGSVQDKDKRHRRSRSYSCCGEDVSTVSGMSARSQIPSPTTPPVKKQSVDKKSELTSVQTVQSAKKDVTKTRKRKATKVTEDNAESGENAQPLEPPMTCPKSAKDAQREAGVKRKPPVWAAAGKSRRSSGARKSMRINKDLYEFSFDSAEEVIKKKVVRHRKKVKKQKAKPVKKKMTLMTTDPKFEITLPSHTVSFTQTSQLSTAAQVNTANSLTQLSTAAQVNTANSLSPEECSMDIHTADDDPGSDDEAVIEAAREPCIHNEEVCLEFQGETASSFVGPTLGAVPSLVSAMASVSNHPTPAISKHISKYIGGSSTPRFDNNLSSSSSMSEAPVDIQKEIGTCFGFDNDQQTEDSELNLSPVHRLTYQSSLEITGQSDILDMDCHPARLPSRFSWGSLRPGNRTNMSSVSRTSSLSVQGGSAVSSQSVVGQESSRRKNPPLSSKTALGKWEREHRRQKKGALLSEASGAPPSIHEQQNECNGDTSVLFDCEEEVEEAVGGTEERQEGGLPHNTAGHSQLNPSVSPATFSPEKPVVKRPRRSYDRTALKQARRTFIEEYGGFAGTSTDSEDDELPVDEQKKKKKAVKSTKKNTTRKGRGTQRRQLTSTRNQETSLPVNNSKAESRKKKDIVFEKSAAEWASHLNDHFGEIDNSVLLVL